MIIEERGRTMCSQIICKFRLLLSLKENKSVSHSPPYIVIICTYGEFDEVESKEHQPTLVYFDKDNNITGIKNSIPEQKLHSV